jgi:hypothetical protein
MLFIRLITSALSPSKEFIDASALARFYGVSQRQADRVWDACIRHGVLKKATYGYSARQWLIENGFLGNGKTREERNAVKRPVESDSACVNQLSHLALNCMWAMLNESHIQNLFAVSYPHFSRSSNACF